MLTRETIITNIHTFVAQRPGFDWGNYGDLPSYRADVRRAGQQLQDAREMLRAVELRTGAVDLARMLAAGADGGRLTVDPKTGRIDYCTGQYWCTEYRAGACRYLSGLLWSATREAYPHLDGDGLRAHLAREFGRGLARRWFN